MRAGVSLEREERESAQGSNDQVLIGSAKPKSASGIVRTPGGRGMSGGRTDAGLPSSGVALSLPALFSLAVLSWRKEHKRPAAAAAPPHTVAVPGSLADDDPHSVAWIHALCWRMERQEPVAADNPPDLKTAKEAT